MVKWFHAESWGKGTNSQNLHKYHKMSAEFIENQRKYWNRMSYHSVCRFVIERSNKDDFKIRKSGFLRWIFYYLMCLNSAIKMGYLIVCYQGMLLEVHFLDQMSMWDWYLSGLHTVQEIIIWYGQYPVFEVMYQNWKLQESIYRRLGKPEGVNKKISRADRKNKYIYHFLVSFGTLALLFQFFWTPKYALNTYAIINESYDTMIMRIIFCAHECLFMYHAYIHQVSVMLYTENLSIAYTHLLGAMNECLYRLIDLGKQLPIKNKMEDSSLPTDPFSLQNLESTQEIMRLKSGRWSSRSGRERISLKKHHFHISNEQSHLNNNHKIKDYLYLDPKEIVPGTEYDIETLLKDYKKMELAMKAHNSWMGAIMGGCIGTDFAQFTSDVFMMIQLLQEPDTDLMGIAFYFMDMQFGVMMLFRMFILISRLAPQSEEFLHGLKTYSQYNTPMRSFLMKSLPSMRVVGPKLGADTVAPQSVPDKANLLINWYVAAAMWKRPADRRT